MVSEIGRMLSSLIRICYNLINDFLTVVEIHLGSWRLPSFFSQFIFYSYFLFLSATLFEEITWLDHSSHVHIIWYSKFFNKWSSLSLLYVLSILCS